MFIGLSLVAFGLLWFLSSIGLVRDATFGIGGSILITFAGLLKVLHLKKGRKDHDSF